jgi:hypothetical protein
MSRIPYIHQLPSPSSSITRAISQLIARDCATESYRNHTEKNHGMSCGYLQQCGATMNHLEDSNDWTPNDLRWAEFTEDLQRFEQCMRHFFLLYTSAMRQLPSDNVVPVAAHLDYTVVHELRKTFLVTVHYLRYHLRRDELPLRPFRLSKNYSRLLDHEHVPWRACG